MRKTIFLFFTAILLSGFVSAQDACKSFLPDEGTILVYNNYDKKGKLSGTTTTEVVSVKVKDDGIHYKVNQLVSDGKKKKNDMETSKVNLALCGSPSKQLNGMLRILALLSQSIMITKVN